jgi:hypothetical protein
MLLREGGRTESRVASASLSSVQPGFSGGSSTNRGRTKVSVRDATPQVKRRAGVETGAPKSPMARNSVRASGEARR